MLDEGWGCAEVVARLAAVSRGLNRLGLVLSANGLEKCPARAGGGDAADGQQLKRLFLSLA